MLSALTALYSWLETFAFFVYIFRVACLVSNALCASSFSAVCARANTFLLYNNACNSGSALSMRVISEPEVTSAGNVTLIIIYNVY